MTIQPLNTTPNLASTTTNAGIARPSNSAASRGIDAGKASASVTSPAAEPSLASVQKATQEVQKIVQSMASNLEFSVDNASGRTVVKLTDTQTGETIRQIPSVEMLELAQDIERFQGVLLKQTA